MISGRKSLAAARLAAPDEIPAIARDLSHLSVRIIPKATISNTGKLCTLTNAIVRIVGFHMTGVEVTRTLWRSIATSEGANHTVYVPKPGYVNMAETLRFNGQIKTAGSKNKQGDGI